MYFKNGYYIKGNYFNKFLSSMLFPCKIFLYTGQMCRWMKTTQLLNKKMNSPILLEILAKTHDDNILNMDWIHIYIFYALHLLYI